MLDAATARLAILGQTIDVSTPHALQPGTSLNVAVVKDGATLKLVLQQDTQAAPQQAPAANNAALRTDAAALLPAAARAAIIGALLGSLSTSQTASVEQAAPSPAQGQPGAAPAAQEGDAQPQAGVLARNELAAMPQAASPSSPSQTASPSAPSSAHTAQQAAAALPGAPANSAVQNSAQAILIPFQLPQMAQPVMLKVQQEEEDGEEGNGGAESKRTWTVSVSLDAGALGLVHIGIGLRQGSVSVRLSAGTPQGAAHLSTWLPELKASLEQADFVPGELSAAQAQAGQEPGPGTSQTI
jgi:hypothetical protein